MAGKFKVRIHDLHHFADPEYEYSAGTFDTLEEAVAECKKIIEEQLPKAYKEGMTPQKLYSDFIHWGEEPYIVAPGYIWGPDDPDINAIAYFKERACEICGAPPGSLDKLPALRKDPKYAKWVERWYQFRVGILGSDLAKRLRPSTRKLLFRGE